MIQVRLLAAQKDVVLDHRIVQCDATARQMPHVLLTHPVVEILQYIQDFCPINSFVLSCYLDTQRSV